MISKIPSTIHKVYGYKNILLVDTERNSYCLFPKTLSYDIELLYEGVSQNSDYRIDKTLYSFLMKNSMLISTYVDDQIIDNKNELKQINYSYCSIANVIIEWSEENYKMKSEISQSINSIGAKQVVILIYNSIQLSKLDNFISCFISSRIQNIDIYLNLYVPSTTSSFNELIEKYQRINNLTVFDNRNLIIKDTQQKFNINNNQLTFKLCGVIEQDQWVTNIFAVNEAYFHNTCLYKKLTIDKNGNIKNCPSMHELFGNIHNNSLSDAVEKPGFKKYWNINKDKIHVCKDCEFRYICTDCRAYVEDTEDIYSKPLKCGYNPYTGEWTEWSTNPLKQKAINFYGLREMVESMSDE